MDELVPQLERLARQIRDGEKALIEQALRMLEDAEYTQDLLQQYRSLLAYCLYDRPENLAHISGEAIIERTELRRTLAIAARYLKCIFRARPPRDFG